MLATGSYNLSVLWKFTSSKFPKETKQQNKKRKQKSLCRQWKHSINQRKGSLSSNKRGKKRKLWTVCHHDLLL